MQGGPDEKLDRLGSSDVARGTQVEGGVEAGRWNGIEDEDTFDWDDLISHYQDGDGDKNQTSEMDLSRWQPQLSPRTPPPPATPPSPQTPPTPDADGGNYYAPTVALMPHAAAPAELPSPSASSHSFPQWSQVAPSGTTPVLLSPTPFNPVAVHSDLRPLSQLNDPLPARLLPPSSLSPDSSSKSAEPPRPLSSLSSPARSTAGKSVSSEWVLPSPHSFSTTPKPSVPSRIHTDRVSATTHAMSRHARFSGRLGVVRPEPIGVVGPTAIGQTGIDNGVKGDTSTSKARNSNGSSVIGASPGFPPALLPVALSESPPALVSPTAISVPPSPTFSTTSCTPTVTSDPGPELAVNPPVWISPLVAKGSWARGMMGSDPRRRSDPTPILGYQEGGQGIQGGMASASREHSSRRSSEVATRIIVHHLGVQLPYRAPALPTPNSVPLPRQQNLSQWEVHHPPLEVGMAGTRKIQKFATRHLQETS
ncbi:hypothetical protein M427DRAFT_132864 [Gonapodya prolifera JEL478]|uniref:Uncharacterized protein n=1 Tax=Gonapodya prolifera (strain JEL478) TaxID=1344416 RepID=A0A139AMY6_GONPJ|nr:hypothetical protein M427DRAFT_132864 [Gonapodya prolifera JEL478]|eukprot:KXS18078.1 hypothetical protein M427DRAFT_132864 [Gonapodya prolifera JEL478]